jgi:hypothetical protein
VTTFDELVDWPSFVEGSRKPGSRKRAGGDVNVSVVDRVGLDVAPSDDLRVAGVLVARAAGTLSSADGGGVTVFGLLAKVAEILASYGTTILNNRRTAKDADVADHLLRIVVVLQELCTRGERLLGLVDGFLAGNTSAEAAAEYEALLSAQMRALGELRTTVEESRGLLATIDAGLYLELAPFLDAKSGLLTRWSQQAEQSRFSTTTLFFLPSDRVSHLAEVGRGQISPDGMGGERMEYVAAVKDSMREVRSHEIRDVRGLGEQAGAAEQAERVRSEVAAARAELVRARSLCSSVLTSTERAVGPEALASLRRRLLSESS